MRSRSIVFRESGRLENIKEKFGCVQASGPSCVDPLLKSLSITKLDVDATWEFPNGLPAVVQNNLTDGNGTHNIPKRAQFIFNSNDEAGNVPSFRTTFLWRSYITMNEKKSVECYSALHITSNLNQSSVVLQTVIWLIVVDALTDGSGTCFQQLHTYSDTANRRNTGDNKLIRSICSLCQTVCIERKRTNPNRHLSNVDSPMTVGWLNNFVNVDG
ncbi:hypothetical protein AB6A40_006095 [Gnathostoma spinigerum]|uniref:Uncharacterized protein n=1 Tax=Gnathostoma spinigerum TaxID=75299 RepID=A0ABD6EI17_9BILA